MKNSFLYPDHLEMLQRFPEDVLERAQTTSQCALWGNISTGVKPSAR